MAIRLSFQDDYLDCFGDPEVIGKVNANKFSFIFLFVSFGNGNQ